LLLDCCFPFFGGRIPRKTYTIVSNTLIET
jgi:hypothetical protein